MTINSFTEAQHRMLARFAVEAESRFIDVPVVNGRAQVLVAGEGPPVMMVGGIGTPAAMWAPLMAQLPAFHLHAVDLPGFGLTDTKRDLTRHYRATAVQFLCETLDQLGLDRAPFVASSLGKRAVITRPGPQGRPSDGDGRPPAMRQQLLDPAGGLRRQPGRARP